MYCEQCGTLFEANRCPECGSEDVRMPLPDDLCFLTERELMWGEMLEDVLRQHRIPVLEKRLLGAGVTARIGPMFERVRLYVPYSHLPEAQEAAMGLFSAPQTGE